MENNDSWQVLATISIYTRYADTHTHTHTHIYIYIYISAHKHSPAHILHPHREGERERETVIQTYIHQYIQSCLTVRYVFIK